MSHLSRLRGRWSLPIVLVVLALIGGTVFWTRSGDAPPPVTTRDAVILRSTDQIADWSVETVVELRKRLFAW